MFLAASLVCHFCRVWTASNAFAAPAVILSVTGQLSWAARIANLLLRQGCSVSLHVRAGWLRQFCPRYRSWCLGVPDSIAVSTDGRSWRSMYFSALSGKSTGGRTFEICCQPHAAVCLILIFLRSYVRSWDVRHWCAGRRLLSSIRRASLSALLVALVAVRFLCFLDRVQVRPLIDIYPLRWLP